MTDPTIPELSLAPPVPLISPDAEPCRKVLFGDPRWLPHLGGSFYGPEEGGGISYNWVGEGRCWCVLPNLPRDTDYAVRLDAAPIVPYNAQLQEVRLLAGDRQLCRHYVPVETDTASCRLHLNTSMLRTLIASSPGDPSQLPHQLRFEWRRLPAPAVRLSVNNLPAGRAEYEFRPEVQRHEYRIFRDMLTGAEHTILGFEPNFAIEPSGLDGRNDPRHLSFRFYQLELYPLPAF